MIVAESSDSCHQNAEERSLIKKIIEATQGSHDQELAQVRNELHRRDNLISGLQEAKNLLENSLAKHLQVKIVAVTRCMRYTVLNITWRLRM